MLLEIQIQTVKKFYWIFTLILDLKFEKKIIR